MNITKKIVSLALCATLALSAFAGCGASASSAASSAASQAASSLSAAAEAGQTEYHVGLVQLVEHPSLDEIREAITTELSAKADEAGITVTVDYQNGQGDATTLNTICQQFVADDVDLIIAIATGAAQTAAAVAPADMPVLFAAVTDPVGAGLVENPDAPEANVTGTSDPVAVADIFKLAGTLTPDAKNFGLLYCTSEDNSASVIASAKSYLDENGLTYVEGAVTAVGDVQTVTENLVGKVDAIFIPIDNTVASAMTAVAAIANKAGVPVYVSADSMVNDGGLATVGINFTDLGHQTGDMAAQLLTGTPVSEVPVRAISGTSVTVNEETASAVGVDVSAYLG